MHSLFGKVYFPKNYRFRSPLSLQIWFVRESVFSFRRRLDGIFSEGQIAPSKPDAIACCPLSCSLMAAAGLAGGIVALRD